MAERLSKHCWVTPKCGIITASKHLTAKIPSSGFQFVIVRNPYNRIVSFYISKVIEYDGDQTLKEIPHINAGDRLNGSFEKMVPLLSVGKGVDRHLRLQSHKIVGSEKGIYRVRCEHWIEDMKLVCEKLGWDHAHYGYVWENRSITTDAITEYVGDKSPTWFRENGTPSDYGLFYNDETRQLIRDIYRADFDWLSDVYDDLEAI